MTGMTNKLARLAPQQRYLSEAFAGAAPDNVPRAVIVLEIEGTSPSIEDLRSAASRLAARAEILRTRFQALPGHSLPVQSIAPVLSPDVTIGDASDRDPLATMWESAIDQESSSPLAIVLGNGRVVVRLPALCADARTLDLVTELLVSPSAAGAVPIEFAEVAEWLCDFTCERAAAESVWWQARAFPTPLLPFERPSTHRNFIALHWAVPKSLHERVSLHAGKRDVSEEACWLTAWWIVLARIAQAGLAIAVEFDGRRYDGLEDCLGPLARRAPLGWAYDGRLSVEEIVRAVQRDLELGRDRVEHFDPRNDGSLGRFGFAWRSGKAVFTGSGLTLRPLARRIHAGPFAADLCFEHRTASDRVTLDATLLIEAGSIEAGAGEELKRLVMEAVAAVVEQPSASLQDLSFSVRNEPAKVISRPGTLLESLEHWATSTPDRIAVVDEAGLLTFGQLWAHGGRLANRLSALGAGPERPIALLMGRSSAAVLAMVAAWRCGACYLPLDPMLPPARLQTILRQLPVAALVVSSEYADLVQGVDVAVLRLNRVEPSPDMVTGSLPRSNPESCAYLLSTSGSTGVPKVVVVEHRQLHAYATALVHQLKFGDSWKFGIVSPWFADIGLTMLAGAFITGGSLHIMPEARLLNADAFGAFVRDHGLQCLKIVPTHLQALFAGRETADILPKEMLILGGEQPAWSLVRQIAAIAPRLRLVNHYGPTETTVGVVTGEIDPAEADHLARPMLGRALPNADVHILDEKLRPVPAWMPGQIHIGGLTVARGYVGARAATARAYLPDPFSERAGSRMYATGDMARRCLDGRIEFLGRSDRQVKIRGLRVEPDELEAALHGTRGIARAAVVVRGEPPSGPRLAAYVVLAPDHPFDAAAIRRELADTLPSYLLPSSITAIADLPMTASGKLDVARLPAETNTRGGALATRKEREIGALWCEVLGTTSVGREDSFFELGGHSLALAELSLLLRDRLGLDFPLPELFRHPTVAAMARMADKQAGQDRTRAFAKARNLAEQRRVALTQLEERAEKSKGTAT
ncbi:amino acid adenylation domain-containing protein [Bradyrhizobium ontarionense]|uniref:Amino acid adenylation domain-containing protein n=1 Tax=Bradyrhizobium ontarionense TaxID=2898149 RepID=A0ABY3R8F9_9BRAD|nr:amino acid adenylation domain-containing protein [Bradyrhizobium sp. A19]UFZ03312.1 amino acid adenylation domain-containing protein [Bradyrhizobium sp. A19]